MAHLPSWEGCGDILTLVSWPLAMQYPMAAVQSLVRGQLATRSSRHRPTRNRCLGMCQKSGWRTIYDLGIRYVSITC
jgi:hypothetical protein